MKLGGEVSGQVLFLFKLYLIVKKEYMYPVSNIGEECVFLNSEEDESVRELCNSVFMIKCEKPNSFMFPFSSWNI